MRRLGAVAILGLAACTAGPVSRPMTEVLLIVDATPSVRMQTARLHVEISASDSRDGPFTGGTVVEDYGPPSSPVGYPRRFGLVPLDGDAKRFFEVRATAFDATTPMPMEVTQTIVRSGYVGHELLELRIVLDDACHGVTCPTDQTCRHGMCQAIFVDPGMLPQGDAGVPEDGATDGAALPDAMPPVDGAPLPDGFVLPSDGGTPDMPAPIDGGPIDAGCIASSCDDGNACNGAESCVEGSCVAGSAPYCDDGLPCTRDDCDRMAGCTHTPDDTLCTALAGGTCSASLGCQYPTCNMTTCVPDPMNCMTATCATSTCMRTSSCTGAQICCGGACAPAGCDDGNPCTDDACIASGCAHTNNANACSDGIACTTSDHCSGGVCVAGPAACDDGNPCTDDTCGATGCAHTGNGNPCEDGDSCTYPDQCQPTDGTCHPGAMIYCDDGLDCTNDFCRPDGTCGTTPATGMGCYDPIRCRFGICSATGFCGGGSGGGCGSTRVCCGGTCSPRDECL